MRIIPALLGAGLVAGVATATIAQTTPAPTTTNSNTKVYAYKKTAPPMPSNNTGATTLGTMPSYENGNPAPYGTSKWWEIRDRTHGGGGEGGSP